MFKYKLFLTTLIVAVLFTNITLNTIQIANAEDSSLMIDAENIIIVKDNNEIELRKTSLFRTNILKGEKKVKIANDKEEILIKNEIEKIKIEEDVKSVQPNYIYKMDLTWVNEVDKDYPTDYNENKYWYYSKSNIEKAWNFQNCPEGNGCGGNKEVVVAVIDSGLSFENFDDTDGLTGGKFIESETYNTINLFNNSKEIANNKLDDDCNGYVDDINGADTYALLFTSNTCTNNIPNPTTLKDLKSGHPVDSFGHGSFITGLIASNLDNNSISPAFNISIMPIAANIHFDEYFTTQTIALGLNYAIDNQADIINMSLTTFTNDSLIESLIEKAELNNILIVAASGNENSNRPAYPAAYPTVLSVGALKADDTRSFYSNFGIELDLVAYVGDVNTENFGVTQNTLQCFQLCTKDSIDDGFKDFTLIGTSAASPQVAALGAMIKSLNPNLTAEDIRDIITKSAKDIGTSGFDLETGYGALDYYNALLITPSKDFINVYRFFNNTNGAHLYTISETEKAEVLKLTDQWEFEGNKFLVSKELGDGLVPVYRFFNTNNGAHIYTIDEDEKIQIALKLPYIKFEGTKFYVYKDSSDLSKKAVYRFFNKTNGAHLYTIDENEKFTIMNTLPQFDYEGVKFFVL